MHKRKTEQDHKESSQSKGECGVHKRKTELDLKALPQSKRESEVRKGTSEFDPQVPQIRKKKLTHQVVP